MRAPVVAKVVPREDGRVAPADLTTVVTVVRGDTATVVEVGAVVVVGAIGPATGSGVRFVPVSRPGIDALITPATSTIAAATRMTRAATADRPIQATLDDLPPWTDRLGGPGSRDDEVRQVGLGSRPGPDDSDHRLAAVVGVDAAGIDGLDL